MKKELKSYAVCLLQSKLYTRATLLTLVYCFLFHLTNFIPFIDDLATNYYRTVGLPMLGRFAGPILTSVFGFFEEAPAGENIIGLLLLWFAVLLINAMFQYLSGGRISTAAQTVFACLVFSCPLIPSSFAFYGMIFNCGVCFLLTAVSICLLWLASESRRYVLLLFPTLLMILAVSMYESFAVLYVSLVLAFAFVEHFYQSEKAPSYYKHFWFIALVSVLVLGVSVLAKELLSRAVVSFFGLPGLHLYAPIYTLDAGLIGQLITTVKTMVMFHLTGLWDVGVLAVNLGVILLLAVAVVSLFKIKPFSKGLLSALLLVILALSMDILMMIRGTTVPLRTLQSVWVVVPFAAAIVFSFFFQNRKKAVRNCVVILAVLAVIWQGSSVNSQFYRDLNAKRIEISDIEKVYETVARDYPTEEKPVILFGEYPITSASQKLRYTTADHPGFRLVNRFFGETIQKYYDTSSGYIVRRTDHSLLTETLLYPGTNKGITRYDYLDYLGIGYVSYTKEQYQRAKKDAASMPDWGNEGCIKEADDYIVVKLYGSVDQNN